MGPVLQGRITRVAGGKVYAVVPRLGSGERGPLPYMRHRVTVPARNTDTADLHAHPIPAVTVWSDPPKAGDKVIVAVMGSIDELIVLGVHA